ncbi:MAG: hypothetical protein HY348_09020, partial [Nitrospira defluvii]|nr:hypothetical protein [Nitrospira defluvii]
MSKPIVEFCILESVDVTAASTKVRVQLAMTPSFNGFTSGDLAFEVPTNTINSAVRTRVSWKIKQETGLVYQPDELKEVVLRKPTPQVEPVMVEPEPLPEP